MCQMLFKCVHDPSTLERLPNGPESAMFRQRQAKPHAAGNDRAGFGMFKSFKDRQRQKLLERQKAARQDRTEHARQLALEALQQVQQTTGELCATEE